MEMSRKKQNKSQQSSKFMHVPICWFPHRTKIMSWEVQIAPSCIKGYNFRVWGGSLQALKNPVNWQRVLVKQTPETQDFLCAKALFHSKAFVGEEWAGVSVGNIWSWDFIWRTKEQENWFAVLSIRKLLALKWGGGAYCKCRKICRVKGFNVNVSNVVII